MGLEQKIKKNKKSLPLSISNNITFTYINSNNNPLPSVKMAESYELVTQGLICIEYKKPITKLLLL